MPFSRELFPLRRSVLFCVQVCALATVATQEPFANCFPNMLHQNGMQKYSFSQNFFDSALPSAPAARQMTRKQCERVIFWSRLCWFQPWMCSSFRVICSVRNMHLHVLRSQLIWLQKNSVKRILLGTSRKSDWTVHILCRMVCHERSIHRPTGSALVRLETAACHKRCRIPIWSTAWGRSTFGTIYSRWEHAWVESGWRLGTKRTFIVCYDSQTMSACPTKRYGKLKIWFLQFASLEIYRDKDIFRETVMSSQQVCFKHSLLIHRST